MAPATDPTPREAADLLATKDLTDRLAAIEERRSSRLSLAQRVGIIAVVLAAALTPSAARLPVVTGVLVVWIAVCMEITRAASAASNEVLRRAGETTAGSSAGPE
jgi:hypothetical protein